MLKKEVNVLVSTPEEAVGRKRGWCRMDGCAARPRGCPRAQLCTAAPRDELGRAAQGLQTHHLSFQSWVVPADGDFTGHRAGAT